MFLPDKRRKPISLILTVTEFFSIVTNCRPRIYGYSKWWIFLTKNLLLSEAIPGVFRLNVNVAVCCGVDSSPV
jgi:hypothetical protein